MDPLKHSLLNNNILHIKTIGKQNSITRLKLLSSINPYIFEPKSFFISNSDNLIQHELVVYSIRL